MKVMKCTVIMEFPLLLSSIIVLVAQFLLHLSTGF